MMEEWVENETRGLVREYRDVGLISETQQAELLALVAEGKAAVAIDILLSIP